MKPRILFVLNHVLGWKTYADELAKVLAERDDVAAEVAINRPGRLHSLLVKRLAIHPLGRRVTVQSDNPAYPDWPDCGLDDVHCIGRVIWAGRKIA